ncbi:unnamed protein product [Lactuca saligna]|uniref:Uncharacterized protein n=1 Tax=Lactuca saligna TaxID=75948 RepID=A0AA35VA63_LACSI|nr:unnamed protein product [Lactuca saligna]
MSMSSFSHIHYVTITSITPSSSLKKICRFSKKKMNADLWARPNFNLWSVSPEPPKNTPVVEYGKPNDKCFTIRVVHGGFFLDYPGKAYQQTKVHFISHVNIDLLDMELLGRFSRSLGYTILGNWYHMLIGEHSGCQWFQ